MFGFLNPWLLLAVLCTTLAAFGGGYLKGSADSEAKQAQQELLIQKAAEAAQMAAAGEIAKIQIKHTTIKRQVEREIKAVPVYSDCRHSPDGLRLINQALGNRDPIDDKQLSGKSRGSD